MLIYVINMNEQSLNKGGEMIDTVEGFQKEFMSLKQAAEVLHVKAETFYDPRWRKSMGITLHAFGNGRKKFVRRYDIFSKLRAS